MNCPNHPDAIADVHCASCGTAYCRDCVVDIGGKPYCARCKDEQIRDMRSGVSGSAFDLASPWARFGAQFVDGLIFMGIFVVCLVVMMVVAPPASRGDRPPSVGGIYVLYLVAVLLTIVYEWRMLAASGATLGKRAFGLKVVRDDGSALGSSAWKRPVARWVYGIIPFVGIVDVLTVFSEQHRTLHDRTAKTLVVNARR